MSVYLVTWKTCVIDGKNTEGNFMYECDIDDYASAIETRDYWLEYVKENNPNAKGGNFLITGAFKL